MAMEILCAANIEQLTETLDAALRRVGDEIVKSYNEHGDAEIAKGSVTLKIDIGKHKDYDDWYKIQFSVKEANPQRPASSIRLACVEKGKLAVQVMGRAGENPRQETIFGGEKSAEN